MGRGFIGSKLARSIPNAVNFECDIRCSGSVRQLLKSVQPQAIVNCAGKTGTPNIDWCEINQDETWSANVLGAEIIKRHCDETKTYLVHLSSGCIFDTRSERISVRSHHDVAKPISFYAKTKAEAEKTLEGNAAIVRIRLPIDSHPHKRNLLCKLSKFQLALNSLNSITVLDDLVRLVRLLLQLRPLGVFHCVSPEPTSPANLRMSMVLRGLASREFEIATPKMLESHGLVHACRTNLILCCERTRRLGFEFEPTDRAVGRILASYGRHRKLEGCNE